MRSMMKRKKGMNRNRRNNNFKKNRGKDKMDSKKAIVMMNSSKSKTILPKKIIRKCQIKTKKE